MRRQPNVYTGPMLRIVPVYAALLALMFLVLSIRVIGVRRAERVSLGVGSSALLERRIRTHGNFAEYVPFALLLLAMAELRGTGPLWLHALCIVLVVARIAHAAALAPQPQITPLRVAGMAGTLIVLTSSAILILAT